MGSGLRGRLQAHRRRADRWLECGRYDEAERDLREAVRLCASGTDPEPVELAEAAAALGALLQSLGRPGEAERALRLAVRVFEQTCGATDPRLAEPLSALGAVCQLKGDFPGAEGCYRRAIAVVSHNMR